MPTLDFSTYSGLQAAALSFMDRNDTDEVKGWIRLAEARLNRKLPAVEVDAALTGVAASRNIDISSLSIAQPNALWIADVGGDELPVTLKSLGTMALIDDGGFPTQWAMDVADSQIVFNRPCDEAYSFRLVYRERFALSDSVATNWLLTNHPDLYLAATMMWGAGYREDMPSGVTWKGLLDEGIDEVRHEIAKNKGNQLSVDPALSLISRPYRGLTIHDEV